MSATSKPSPKFTWIVNYMVGKETPGSDDTRNLFDTTLTVAPTEKLSLMANFDYGKEGDVKWWGIAGYAKLPGPAELGPRRPLRVHRRHATAAS